MAASAGTGGAKVAVVTGASSGIGEAAVKRFLEQGYVTYAAARRLDRMKELERLGAILLPLDLINDASVVQAVERIRSEQNGRVDVLLNNAGYGSYGAVEDVPLDEARRQFEVNLFGLARLVQLVTPLMRERHAGRIVNVSSMGGKGWEPLGAWYHATKFALEGFSDCLRMELKPFGIDVIVIEPGAIRTEWGPIALETLDRTSGHTAYAPQAQEKRALFLAAEGGASDPDLVAREIMKAAQARRPKTRYAVGSGAKPAIFMVTYLPNRAVDWLFATATRSLVKRSLKAPEGKNGPAVPART
jgi:NAD(P)-dependent dehydrogenase (short-subunit alcohol dehydrogenase family)